MKKILVFLSLVLSVVFLFAQNAIKPVQINVFKNGTYFIAKEGNVPVKKGYAMLELPKQPLLGTYWLNAAKENKITSVCFVTDTIKKTKKPQNFNDIFKGSVGKKVRFSYAVGVDKNLREISGVLQEYYEGSGIAKIKLADNKTTFYPVASVVEFTIDDSNVGELTMDSLVRVAKIYFDKSISATDLRVVYMQTGIQWIPSYNIRIINDNELQLEMKALVENYSEDIENAELTLTVGNPQFFYGVQYDPIYNNMLTSLYEVKPMLPVAQSQTYFTSNVFVAEERTTTGTDFNQYADYSTQGEKTNDLYMYRIGKVNLPMQSKSSFQIFSVKVPYKDVYEVNIGDVANYSYYSYISNDPEKRMDVYHSLLLTNNTTYPFTTAPVFVQDEHMQPLAQDRIKYTPTGADISVQLSKAGDVVVKNKEEEVKKEENVKKIGKTYYNKVTVKGMIFIENLQKKKILLTIKKDLTANALSAGSDGVISKSGRYSGLNPYVNINWELPLNAGEKKSVVYEYEVYAPAGGSSY
ncbi:MAG TPA: hypothetical protein PLB59_07490 [Bacteroidales bacterium]|nr:DUF4139 domain-containing protein [Bacteroidales bacterium]HPB24595.1 hypothetical protein [Bacteroidales bacterium]HPI29521.1 hypothetical protein [Bacteroidales bacterium]HQN16217.1 hypothetical protein [Bacteroidales bacterium]HQP15794.1 hypothetical protein [Bacteroidales bacterium]